MTLYQLITLIRETQGHKNKLTLMRQHKDNKLFKNYMQAVYDPTLNYYLTKLPKYDKTLIEKEVALEFTQDTLSSLMKLATRQITGNKAKQFLSKLLCYLNDEGRELVGYVIRRNINGNVGDGMVLKVWPKMFFIPPYMRCSLLNDSNKEHFSSLPVFYVQEKIDGSFMYLITHENTKPTVMTRAGNIYPKWFSSVIASGDKFYGKVLIGECIVYDNQNIQLSRQEGNGILNSILHNEEQEKFSNFKFKMIVWDKITLEDFYRGYSILEYQYRLDGINVYDNPNLSKIKTLKTKGLDRAFNIYSTYTAQGKEGVVIKDPDSVWKDYTSPFNVKLKLTFEIDLEITNFYEGQGKVAGMLGGLVVQSKEGRINCCVGTGFTDKIRQELWSNKENIIGKIVTVKANDVIRGNRLNTGSLFLPVFVELRNDKTEADSFEHVMNQLESAKQGK